VGKGSQTKIAAPTKNRDDILEQDQTFEIHRPDGEFLWSESQSSAMENLEPPIFVRSDVKPFKSQPQKN